MENFDLKKYLAENKLLKEEEFKLYITNVEYDTGKDGYMYQLVDAEKLNLLVMKIEDEEGGNIDFT